MVNRASRRTRSRSKVPRSNSAKSTRRSPNNLVSDLRASQVLDSRGNPTVEVDLFTSGGSCGRAIVPSGASTGIHEALELRDGNNAIYGGKSVLKAVANVNELIRPRVVGEECTAQKKIDKIMVKLDGTPHKSRLGANAILGVSMALSRAGASSRGEPLYRYLTRRTKYRLPIPMMNVINGGKHAGNKLAIQEFIIEPVGAETYGEALRYGVEVYHSLKSVLLEKYGPSAINVGDEGGYAPPLESTRDALDAILVAIRKAGYNEALIRLGMDPASSSFYDKTTQKYAIDGKTLSADELEDFYSDLVSTYPLLTIEDPFDEDSFSDFTRITRKFGSRIKIIGDDLYVTNKERISRGIREKATNAILIKLNQIGSVTETFEAISMSKEAGFEIIVSHRSGETEDTFISHLATAVESTFIKTGAPARGERTAKYNELLRIENELGTDGSTYAGRAFA
ncbi:MAG: phosphopyruvate hydratase [archaeon]|nr:phosphopyruvate hydratase [archaeon]